MKKDLRKAIRFTEIARVDCLEICALPGVLDDISSTGCRVHFPGIVSVDLESETEIELSIRFSNPDLPQELQLVVVPCRIVDHPEESECEVGFRIMRSPDTPLLKEYIEKLQEKSDDDSDITDLIIQQDVEFV